MVEFKGSEQFCFSGMGNRTGTPIILTEQDFKAGKLLYEQEEYVEPTKDNLFPAAVYCVLSATEDHEKQVAIYERLRIAGLLTPEDILNSPESLCTIIQTARYPNSKSLRLQNLSRWWLNSSLPSYILSDVTSDKLYEFYIRQELASKTGAPGMKEKCASYFMGKIGYENVVPVDIWVMRYLESLGEEVKIPDYRRQSGPTGKIYLVLEKLVQDKAKEYGVTPADLQRAIWVKMSGWRYNQGLNVKKRVNMLDEKQIPLFIS